LEKGIRLRVFSFLGELMRAAPKGITGQALEELRERKKADQRERKRRSRTNQKQRTEDEERFKVVRRSRRLVEPGDVDPERPGRYARTVEEAIPNVRRWLRALGLVEIKSGESLRDVQRRIYDKLRELRNDPDAEGFPVLSLTTGKLDPDWVFDYAEPYSLEEEWPSIPGDEQPIFSPPPVLRIAAANEVLIERSTYDPEAYRERRQADVDAQAKRGFDAQHEKAQRGLKAVRGASFPLVED
jgi:hypothetical protein